MTIMWSDLAILLTGLACLAVGGVIGVIGMYVWLLNNTDGCDDQDPV